MAPATDATAEAASKRSPSANGLKRHRDDIENEAEESAKRQRRSEEKEESPTATGTTRADGRNHDKPVDTQATEPRADEPKDGRRKSGAVDEKKRSKRLFGALLGNLNRPSSDRTTKRRAEIETRRKAELQRQDEEAEEDKARRAERLLEHRKRVQRDVLDEEVMRLRHRAMLERANFLQTRTEPRLFYRPWELRVEEEERIEEQVREAKKVVEREMEEWEAEKERREPMKREDRGQTGGGRVPAAEGGTDGDDVRSGGQDREQQDIVGSLGEKPAESQSSPPGETPVSLSGAQNTVESRPAASEIAPAEVEASEEQHTGQPRQEPPTHADAEDEQGDHVVEGDEDTVIY